MNINKETLDDFRKDFSTAVLGLERKYGVSVTIGTVSYSNTEFTTRMTVKNRLSNDPEEDEKQHFMQECELYGFKKDQYRKRFRYDGNLYELIGFYSRAKKYRCKVRCLTDGDGKEYAMVAASVKSMIEQKS